jgi:hypothetical protein
MATEEPPEGLRRRKTGLTQGDEKAKDRTTALLSAAPNQVSAVLEKAGPAIQAVIYVMKIVVVRWPHVLAHALAPDPAAALVGPCPWARTHGLAA